MIILEEIRLICITDYCNISHFSATAKLVICRVEHGKADQAQCHCESVHRWLSTLDILSNRERVLAMFLTSKSIIGVGATKSVELTPLAVDKESAVGLDSAAYGSPYNIIVYTIQNTGSEFQEKKTCFGGQQSG